MKKQIKKVRVNLNGKTYEVDVELLDEKEDQDIKSQKKEKPIETSNTVSDNGIQQDTLESNQPKIITSPLAGKIMHIHAKLGDTVHTHQQVFLLEAMKMETPVESPFSGIVKKIYVSENTQVQFGTPLLELE